MPIDQAIDALLRQKMLEDIYSRMSDDEKKLFVQMALQNRSADEILQALQQQSEQIAQDRKSTRLNSSHTDISYAVFCLHT